MFPYDTGRAAEAAGPLEDEALPRPQLIMIVYIYIYIYIYNLYINIICIYIYIYKGETLSPQLIMISGLRNKFIKNKHS